MSNDIDQQIEDRIDRYVRDVLDLAREHGREAVLDALSMQFGAGGASSLRAQRTPAKALPRLSPLKAKLRAAAASAAAESVAAASPAVVEEPDEPAVDDEEVDSTPPAPEPVPLWRQLVDPVTRELTSRPGAKLYDLAEALDQEPVDVHRALRHLAQKHAVRRAGDGWSLNTTKRRIVG